MFFYESTLVQNGKKNLNDSTDHFDELQIKLLKLCLSISITRIKYAKEAYIRAFKSL